MPPKFGLQNFFPLKSLAYIQLLGRLFIPDWACLLHNQFCSELVYSVVYKDLAELDLSHNSW